MLISFQISSLYLFIEVKWSNYSTLPRWAIRIVVIALLYAVAILFFVIHIQSIGSGLSISSDLFNNFLFTKSCIGLEEISLLLLSLVPVKPKRLTKSEREVFSLGQEQKDSLIGLLLGDLNIRKRYQAWNPVLRFVQGLVHKDYIYHLYELF